MSLLIRLGWDAKPATRGIARTEKRLKRFERNTERGFRKMQGAAASLFGVAMAAGLKTVTTEMAGLNHESSKLGVSSEFLQRFKAAAIDSGGVKNAAAAGMGLQRFARRTAEAAAGTGEAKSALDALGVQLVDTEGKLRPVEDILLDTATAMDGVEGEGNRLRLGFKLFDSEGAALVNTLQDLKGKMDAIAASEIFSAQELKAGEVLDNKLEALGRKSKVAMGGIVEGGGRAMAVLEDLFSIGDGKGFTNVEQFAQAMQDANSGVTAARAAAGANLEGEAQRNIVREAELAKKRKTALADIKSLRAEMSRISFDALSDADKIDDLVQRRLSALGEEKSAWLALGDGQKRSHEEVLALQQKQLDAEVRKRKAGLELEAIEERLISRAKEKDEATAEAQERQRRAFDAAREEQVREIEELERSREQGAARRGPELDALTSIGLGAGGVNFSLDNTRAVELQKQTVDEIKRLRSVLEEKEFEFKAPEF